MGNNSIVNEFRGDEISKIDNNLYPKVGGRLRLAHEKNNKLSITTTIIKYDGKVAVVSATCLTSKGNFQGIGTASVERDVEFALSILELAETRAIARSLRFSGVGVEFCSAEEVSHLKNRNGIKPTVDPGAHQSKSSQSDSGNYGTKNPSNISCNGGGNGRLSAKQYRFLLQLSDRLGRSKADLDKHCLEAFGTVAQHLTKADCSTLIQELKAQ